MSLPKKFTVTITPAACRKWPYDYPNNCPLFHAVQKRFPGSNISVSIRLTSYEDRGNIKYSFGWPEKWSTTIYNKMRRGKKKTVKLTLTES